MGHVTRLGSGQILCFIFGTLATLFSPVDTAIFICVILLPLRGFGGLVLSLTVLHLHCSTELLFKHLTPRENSVLEVQMKDVYWVKKCRHIIKGVPERKS